MSQNPAKASGSRAPLLSPLMSPGLKSPGGPGLKSPRPQPLLKRTLAANGSSVSINDMPPPSTPTGIRAQLGHLLPRHAYFRARVVIHEISSVPFVGGEFAVRWKFKGVQANQGSKQKLLERVKGRAENRSAHANESEGRGDDKRLAMKSPGLPEDDSHIKNLRSPSGLKLESHSASGSFVPITPRPSLPGSVSTVSSHSSDVSDSTCPTAEWGHLSVTGIAPVASSSSSTMIPAPESSGTNTPATFDTGNMAPARGATPFVPLKDHSVRWSQTLDTVLKFDIDRETSLILPNPLKLVVYQRIIPGHAHGNPQNPRLGAVYLNLAEYVGHGSVERRYLLKESKTNAILKLTIELEYLSGESNYIPPPLAKGEILNGIAGFLEKESVKKRPRALDLYGPYKNQEELETDLLSGLKSTAKVPKTARSERKIFDTSSRNHTETETEDETTSFEEHETGDEVSVAFDVQRLPVAYGTKTTEMLIESLFNPVKVFDKTEESPFTIYEPPSPDSPPRMRQGPSGGGVIGLGRSGGSRGQNLPTRQTSYEESSSMHATTSDSASEQSHTTSSSLHSRSLQSGRVQAQKVMANARSTPRGRVVVDNTGHLTVASEDSTPLGGVRGWWRRNISRSNLPMTKDSGNPS